MGMGTNNFKQKRVLRRIQFNLLKCKGFDIFFENIGEKSTLKDKYKMAANYVSFLK